MKRTSLAIAALITFAFAGSACSVSLDGDTSADGKWPCESDEDCPEPDQTCQPHPDKSNTKVCTAQTKCFDDNDEDGYGGKENAGENGGPGFRTCPACQNDEPAGCTQDCKDENSKIHPGAPERCNGKDDDCDGKVDEMNCDSEGNCPFNFGDKKYSTPQSGTGWACKSVDGTNQCVMVGRFTSNESCNNEQQSAWGYCRSSGEWTEVPESCTTQQ
ncbi:MAG: putative metal-binding motif-containing protein [Bradymonadaceae bacterium]